ncbi:MULTISPECIES: hypothetical protein [unclassified Kribbella]
MESLAREYDREAAFSADALAREYERDEAVSPTPAPAAGVVPAAAERE